MKGENILLARLACRKAKPNGQVLHHSFFHSFSFFFCFLIAFTMPSRLWWSRPPGLEGIDDDDATAGAIAPIGSTCTTGCEWYVVVWVGRTMSLIFIFIKYNNQWLENKNIELRLIYSNWSLYKWFVGSQIMNLRRNTNNTKEIEQKIKEHEL